MLLVVGAFIFAPYVINILTILKCPLIIAICNGVFLSLLYVLIGAPLLIKNFNNSIFANSLINLSSTINNLCVTELLSESVNVNLISGVILSYNI